MKSIGPSGADVLNALFEIAVAIGILWFFQQPSWLIILIAFLMAESWRQVFKGAAIHAAIERVIELLENAR
jgi:hypothetical protein